MGRERDQFALARSALAGYASAGRFGWGHPLVATSLAAELGLSPTPVREALAHLAGEGVIEHRSGRGYFAPSPTAADIVGLYELHRVYLENSLVDRYDAVEGFGPPSADEAVLVEAAFDRLARQGETAAVTEAYYRVSARLRPIRRIETLLNDTGLGIVRGLLKDGVGLRRDAVTATLDAYHESRFSLSAALEKVMRRSASNIFEI